jgi:heptaprenyl diphosphate synthase
MGGGSTGTTGAKPTTPSPSADTPQRRAFLSRVEERLDRVVRVDPGVDDASTEELVSAARHLVQAGGKRARPWFTMLLGEAFGLSAGPLCDLAVCVELIHAASLLHDDVVDDGTRRRGRPTANAVWGNLTSVLSGDLLLTLALTELRQHPASLHHAAVDTVAAMTRATLREAAARGQVELSPERWFQIAEGKTGALFGLCGRGVGLLAERDDDAERLARAGNHLGLAFQVADDLDDLLGRGVGKDPFADLRNRNPNVAVAMAVETSSALRRKLASAWDDPDTGTDEFARLGRNMLGTGVAERAWEVIGEHVSAAERELEPWHREPSIALVCAWARRMWSRAEPGATTTCAVS